MASNIVDWLMGPTGIEEDNFDFSVLMYPNPATDESNISFDMDAPGQVTITLIDMEGIEVSTEYNGMVDGSFYHKINTDNIPTGAYLVKIKIDNKTSFRKLIKN